MTSTATFFSLLALGILLGLVSMLPIRSEPVRVIALAFGIVAEVLAVLLASGVWE